MTHAEGKRLKALIEYIYRRGFIMVNTCTAMLSTAITKAEIEKLADVVLEGLRETR